MKSIRAWLFSPFHKLISAFALPAITAGAFGADMHLQVLVGLMGLVALAVFAIRTA